MAYVKNKEQDRAEKLGVAITMLSEAVTVLQRQFGLAIAKTGLTLQQYGVLYHLLRVGGPMNQAALARTMSRRSASVSGILDRMERQRLIERKPSEKDGRVFILVVTAKGKKKYRSAAANLSVLEFISKLAFTFSQTELEQLTALAVKMRDKSAELGINKLILKYDRQR